MGLKEFFEGAEKLLKQEKKKKDPTYKESVEKGCYAPPQGGVHSHSLLRSLLKSRIGGTHQHLFVVRRVSGELVILSTDWDGAHMHTMDEASGREMNSMVSAHQHVVRINEEIELENGEKLMPGMILLTEFDGEHPHTADMLESSNFDGGHKHTLKLPGDMEIESLDITDFWEIFGPFESADPRDFVSTEEIISRFSQSSVRIEKMMCGVEVQEDEPDWKKIAAAAFGHELVEKEAVERIFKAKEVSELILSKKQFKSVDDVMKKLEELDYPNVDKKDVEDQPNIFRARIMAPSAFDRDSLKEISLGGGVRALVGESKDELKKEDDDGELTEKVTKSMPEEVLIMKQDDEKRILTGIVLEPEVEDFEGDIISEEEIERAATFFLQNSRTIGFRHKKKLINAKLTSSWVTPVAFTVDGPNGKQKVKKGTWLISVHVPDDEIWAMVKKKMINGLSVGGFGARQVEARK